MRGIRVADTSKTKAELIDELDVLRDRVAQLERPGAAAPSHAAVVKELAVLESLIDRSSAMVFRWRITEGWPVEFASRGVSRLGYTPEQFVSGEVSWPGITHPDDVPRLEAEVSRSIEEGHPGFGQEYRLRDSSGTYHWVEDSNIVFRAPDGSPTHVQGIVFDVTDRKRAEEALRASEERFRSIFEASPIGVYRTTPDGRILDANPATLQMLGYSSLDELATRNLDEEEWYEPDYPRSEFKERLQRDGEVRGLESAWMRRDGTAVFVRESAATICNEAGEPLYYQGTIEDITERKRAEQALRESEERYRTLFENAPVGIGVSSYDGQVLALNDYMVRSTGYSLSEADGFTLADAYESLEDRTKLLARVREDGSVCDYEVRLKRRDGTPFAGLLNVTPINFGGQEALLSMVEDITEKKRAEEERLEYQEQLRSLSSQLALAEERERQRFAASLHDDLGQILSLSRIKLGALTAPAEEDGTSAVLGDVRSLLDQAIEKVRTLTFDIGSPLLHTLGLGAAVGQLADRVRDEHGIAVTLDTRNGPLRLDDDVGVTLFQSIRELLLNVVKHANASSVTVIIRRAPGHVHVEVVDDGDGFEVPERFIRLEDGGYGLFSIRERMSYLGGTFRVESAPGRGTRATMVAPLNGEPLPVGDA